MIRNFTINRRLLAVVLLFAIVSGLFSCTARITESPPTQQITTAPAIADTVFPSSVIEKSIVQVWAGEYPESTGIVIGDGGQVLTVINYEVSFPESVSVMAPDGSNFTASVAALDPRTGATLLAVPALALPGIKTSVEDTPSISQAQNLIAAWYLPEYPNVKIVNPGLQKTWVISMGGFGFSSLFFGIHFPHEVLEKGDPPHIGQGAVVMDEKDNVFGFVGIDYDDLFPHPHALGAIPAFVTLKSALELLSPDFAGKPYANGPLGMLITASHEGTFYRYGYFTNYDEINETMKKILSGVEGSLPAEELPENIYDIATSAKEGSSATVVYPRPVELKNKDGAVVAQARWLTIQYDRGRGKPNRLFFGAGRMDLKGGFYLPDDLSGLEEIIEPLTHQGTITAP